MYNRFWQLRLFTCCFAVFLTVVLLEAWSAWNFDIGFWQQEERNRILGFSVGLGFLIHSINESIKLGKNYA